MTKAHSARKFVFSGWCAVLFMTSFALGQGETSENVPSTQDLEFLIGDWSANRVYQPGTEHERSFDGSLGCEKSLSDQFVKCAFYFERPGAAPINDRVYFNYNEIYGVYESVWLSATWPIKVTMRAKPIETNEKFIWDAEFLIEDGVTEWVRSTWSLCNDGGFSRRTEIRTSRDPEDQWMHWMDERVLPTSTQNAPDQRVENCT